MSRVAPLEIGEYEQYGQCTYAFNAYGNRAAETVVVAIVFNPETITPVREHKTGDGGNTPRCFIATRLFRPARWQIE